MFNNFEKSKLNPIPHKKDEVDVSVSLENHWVFFVVQ